MHNLMSVHTHCIHTQALKRYENVALAESERIVTDVDSLVEQFAVNKPLEFLLEVQIAPKVVWKGAYTGLTVCSVGGEGWMWDWGWEYWWEREWEREWEWE